MRAENEALLVIDVQNDFCPGGALAVSGGDEIIAGLNDLMSEFETVVLTQDWHPDDHASFADNHPTAGHFDLVEMPYGPQVLWPHHCVMDTEGAEFHASLVRHDRQLVLRKGSRAHIDSYSAFFENDRVTATGLDEILKERGITKLTLAGLATDYCVAYSALDARRLGYDVELREDLSRAIDLNGSLAQAKELLLEAGVVIKSC